jgi:hypothetical protein
MQKFSSKETNSMTKLIAGFLGYELTEGEISELLETLPKKEQLSDNKFTEDESLVKLTSFEGVIGDWQNYLSPEQSRRMDELFKARFSKLGLSMSFDPTDAVKRLRQYGRIIINTENKNNSKPKRKKSEPNRPDLTKEEAVLLRKKTLNEIEMLAVESQSKGEEKKCWRNFLKLFCPCFCSYYQEI